MTRKPDKYGLAFTYLNKIWVICFNDDMKAKEMNDPNGIFSHLDDSTLEFVEVYLTQQDVYVLKSLRRIKINDSISRILINEKFPELMVLLWNKHRHLKYSLR